jgi:hypothetical protein
MLAYKGFNSDLTCLGFKYQIGKTYTMNPQNVKLCSKGFHFCQIPIDVLKYYNNPNNKYAVVKVEGIIINDIDKSVTNQLTVIRLITKEELLQLMTGLFIRVNGDQEWYQNGQLHRTDTDLNGSSLPALELVTGNQFWYQNGKLHRLDGPACQYANGDKFWYHSGLLHRDHIDLNGLSLPAIEKVNGTKFWYQNGKLHRLDGPAIEISIGHKSWYQNGQLHRDNGPAIEHVNGNRFWCQNGQLHRLDGPAIELANGLREWYQNGLTL